MKLLIVAASVTGRTQRMAEAAAEGAREAGAEVLLRTPDEAQEVDLLDADAVLLASPVHMSGVAATLRSFLERMAPLWLQGRLVGKLAAALVTAGDGERGGAELTLISLLSSLAEHGMLIVPMHNRLEGFSDAGSPWGAMARTNPGGGEPPGPSAAQLVAARSQGRFLTECTRRWLAGAPDDPA